MTSSQRTEPRNGAKLDRKRKLRPRARVGSPRIAASYETELRNVRRGRSTVLKGLDLRSVMVSQA